MTDIIVKGAGICGLWCAFLLLKAGRSVAIYDIQPEDRSDSCSHRAGGMLAPYCEGESAEPIITTYGVRGLELWRAYFPELTTVTGSLLLAHPRDYNRLEHFADTTQGCRRVNQAEIAELEPDLAERFETGLFYETEGYLEPRRALTALTEAIRTLGGVFHFATPAPTGSRASVIDCTGLGGKTALPALRGVRGETVTVRTEDIKLRRPVRLLHPRHPIYVIPRPDHRYLIGATTVETDNPSDHVTVRSAGELLTQIFHLHPGFAEAEIIEMSAGLRPAFPDHLPTIERNANVTYVNGLYRHGWMIAPAVGEEVTEMLSGG